MLFISHSSMDDPIAARVGQRLQRAGYPSNQLFIDSDAIVVGQDWEAVLYRHLSLCDALIVVCTANWETSRWCFAEAVHAKLARKPVFGLRLADVGRPGILSHLQFVDLRADFETGFAALLAALEAENLGPHDAFAWAPDLCPYPGLPSFTETHAGVFFGREEEVREALAQLNSMREHGVPRLLMLVGGSGAGKSSLLRAGILPRLSGPAQQRSWLPLKPVRYGRLRGEILPTIANELLVLFPGENRPALQLRDRAPEDGARAFVDACHQLQLARGCPQAQVLLVIDQCEELLASTAGRSAEHFLAWTRALCAIEGSPVLVIGTIRSDSIDAYRQHRHAVQAGELEVLGVAPLSPERLPDIIERPASRCGVGFEPALVRQLEKSYANNLPLLALVLERLYGLRIDHRITVDAYQGMGGHAGAIAAAVGQALAAGNAPDALDRLRPVFVKHLVQINHDDTYIRRVARWEDMPGDLRRLLEGFVERRLLTRDGDSIEVAHEQLFDAWADLSRWLNRSRRLLQWRRDVERDRRLAGAAWKRLSTAQLVTALGLLDQHRDECFEQEISWIDAGMHRRNRARAAIWAVASVVLALAGVATWQWRKSVASAEHAEAEAQIAKSQELAAKSMRLRYTDPSLAALLGIESGNAADTVESKYVRMFAAQRLKEFPQRIINTGAAIESMAASHDGTVLVTGATDGLVRLWNRASGAAIEPPLKGSSGAICGVSFDQSGKWLAVCHGGDDPSAAATVELWDVSERRLRTRFDHPNGLRSMQLSRDGRWLVTGGGTFDRCVRLWDTSSGTLVAPPSPVGEAAHVAFSPDATVVAVGTQEGHVLFLRAPDLAPVQATRDFGASIRAIAADPRGGRYAVGQQDGSIRFLDLRSTPVKASDLVAMDAERVHEGPVEQPIAGHTKPVWSLAYRDDGLILASGSEDGTIRLWHTDARQPLTPVDEAAWAIGTSIDAESGALVDTAEVVTPTPLGPPMLRSREPCDDHARCRSVLVDLVGASDTMISATEANLQVWNIATEPPVMKSRAVRATRALSADGNVLAALEGGVLVVSRPGGKANEPEVRVALDDRAEAVMIDHVGNTVVVAGQATISMFRANAFVRRDTEILSGTAQALSGDGRMLAILARNSTISLIDTDNGGSHWPTVAVPGEVVCLDLSLNGDRLVVARKDGRIAVVETRSGKIDCESADGVDEFALVTFSADATLIATASQKSNDVRIWRTADCALVSHALRGHTDAVSRMAFSPNGELLASGSSDATVRLWDVVAQQQIGPPVAIRQAVEGLAFEPSSDAIVVSTRDLPLRRVAFSREALREQGCAIAARNLTYDEWASNLGGVPYRKTCANHPIGDGFLDEARRLGRQGRIEASMAMLERAHEIDPALHIDARRTAQSFLAEAQGESLARGGEVERAIARLKEAKDLDPELQFDPKLEATQLAAASLFERGRQAAGEDRVAEATALVRRAHVLASTLPASSMTPAIAYFEKTVASEGVDGFVRDESLRALVRTATSLSNAGKVEQAALVFNAARKYQPSLPTDTLSHARQLAIAHYQQEAKEAVARGDEVKAATALQSAQRLGATRVPAAELNAMVARKLRHEAEELARAGETARALATFDGAVTRAPGEFENIKESRDALEATAHQARGQQLARTGDLAHAGKELALASPPGRAKQSDPAAQARAMRADAVRMEAHRFLLKNERDKARAVLQELVSLEGYIDQARELQVLALPSREDQPVRELGDFLSNKKPHKAFVFSAKGSWGWAAGMKTIDEAVTAAIDYCAKGGISKPEECKPYALDNKIVDWHP
jgi:WD40 repeat protein/tetratricopeptide (TPR) repeat protein